MYLIGIVKCLAKALLEAEDDRPHKAYPVELAQFHSADYVEFLQTTTLIFGENLWLSILLLMAGRFFVSLCMVMEAILQEFFTRFVPLDDEECGVRLAAIEWLLRKCLTQKILKKKPKNGLKNAKPITKTEDCESFFNFFNTSQVPKDEDDIDEEENYRIKWSKPMTLEEDDDDKEMDDEDEEDANDDDDEEDDEDKEEGKSKRKTKHWHWRRRATSKTQRTVEAAKTSSPVHGRYGINCGDVFAIGWLCSCSLVVVVFVVISPLTNVVGDFSDLVIAFSNLVIGFSDLVLSFSTFVLAFSNILSASLVPVPSLLPASFVVVP
ncbi:nucleosome assembly protein 1 [Tanacetum coccineum]